MIRNNLALKVLALAIAIVVWIQISLLAEHQSTLSLRVGFVNSPKAGELAKHLKKVPFNVRGRGLDILRLKLSKTLLEIDADNLEQARQRIAKMDYEIKNRPLNLDLEIIGPVPDFDLAQGKEAPAVALAGRNNASSGRLDANVSEQGAASPAGKNEQVTTKVLDNVAITSTSGMLYTPPTATLKVEGKPSSLASLPRGLVVLAAEQPDASGTYELSVRLPEGLKMLDFTPKRVRQRK